MNDSIFDLEQAAMERWRNGDPMGFAELSDDNICYVDPGLTKPILGIEANSKYLKDIEGKIHYQKSEFIDPQIVTIGDAGLLTYNYQSSVLTAEGEVSSQTPWNVSVVYVKRMNSWKIVHSHFSFTKHKVPDIVEVPVPVQSYEPEYSGILGELMKLESAAMERWRQGDPWGFIELSAPEVTYFDTGTPKRINGREALRAEYKLREGKIFYEVMDFIVPWAFVWGDMAVLFYRFLSTRLNTDGSVASRVPWNCTEVFQNFAGSWKIIHTHWSHIRGERY